MMQIPTIHPMVALKLIEREVLRVKEHIKKYEHRKIAVFAAGEYGRRFYGRLLRDYGIEAEFFIDNDPLYAEAIVSGKPVLLRPWENDPDFAQKYFVLSATSAANVAQISAQLNEAGIPHMPSDAYEAARLSDRAKKVLQLLDDDFSRASYLGLMWYWLTHNDSLSQTTDYPAFGLRKEIILDLGAYVGDSVENYVHRSIGTSKIYSFEPDEQNRFVLNRRIKRLSYEWGLDDETLSVIPAGVGAETGVLYFHHNEQNKAASTRSERGEIEVQIYALDDFFEDKQPPTLIKADIEGMEQEMLRGATRLIQEHKPKMVLAMYHSPDDLVKLPEIINSLNSTYFFGVRSHSTAYHCTLYCY